MKQQGLNHKSVELWFHIIIWCHPKLVSPGAGSPHRIWLRHCHLLETLFSQKKTFLPEEVCCLRNPKQQYCFRMLSSNVLRIGRPNVAWS